MFTAERSKQHMYSCPEEYDGGHFGTDGGSAMLGSGGYGAVVTNMAFPHKREVHGATGGETLRFGAGIGSGTSDTISIPLTWGGSSSKGGCC